MPRMKNDGYENVNGLIDEKAIGLGWISGITRWNTAKAVHMKPHRHPHMEMIFCLRGELSYEIRGHGAVSVCEGAGIVIPKGTVHVLKGGTDSPCERIGLHIITGKAKRRNYAVFAPADLKSFRATLVKMSATPFRLNPTALAAVKELSSFMRKDSEPSSQECGYLRILCCQILYNVVDILRQPLVSPRPVLMDAAVEYLDRHYAEPIQSEDLIRFTGYGKTRLFTLFKQHTGLTPNEYLVRLRIRKAKDLLATGRTDVRKIAKAVGFSSTSYFRAVFLKYTGRKPNPAQ